MQIVNLEQARAVLELTLGEYAVVRTAYHSAMYDSVDGYLTGSEPITQSKKDMLSAITIAYGATATIAWKDGNGDMTQAAAIGVLLQSTIDEQQGFASQLFERLKLLRPQLDKAGMDAHQTIIREANQRADGYASTLDYFYALVKLMALGEQELMFGGTSGVESCPECEMLMNTWHPASYYVANGYVPPKGENLTCAPGGLCEHVLMDKQGRLVTI